MESAKSKRLKSAKTRDDVLLTLLFTLTVFLVAGETATAQQNVPNGKPAQTGQTPKKPAKQNPTQQNPTTPAKPASKIAPSRVAPEVKHEVSELPQVGHKISSPFRRVLPGGKSKSDKSGGAEGAQSVAQTSKAVGAGSSAQKPIAGKHPSTASASLGPQPGGFRLPPDAKSERASDGGTRVTHPDGRQWVLDKNKHLTTFSKPGLQANYGSDGKVSSLRVTHPNSNMVVTRSPHGERQTVATRPGGVQVVTYGKGRGYVQRPIPGRLGYFKRSSVVDGRPVAHVYRAYGYRGAVYFRYVPSRYYQPKFYSWAQNPWPAAVAYNWERRPAPWLGFYAGYFTPAQAYPTPALWLTDFVIGANLKTAYQNHQEFASPQLGSAPPAEASPENATLTPEVKDKLSQEIQTQVADEQAAASQAGAQAAPADSQAPPPALDPKLSTLVVSQNIDLGEPSAPCTLTPGDVIERTGDSLGAGNKVGVKVVSSKAGDCPANTSQQMDVVALQEMSNQFHEQIDAGLSTLAASGGQAELPPAPAAGARAVPEGTAPSDPDVAATLAQQQTDAMAAEKAAADAQNAVVSM